MSEPNTQAPVSAQPTGEQARALLLEGLDATEQRMELAGISTPVLSAGDGPPVVLLHDPGGHAARWVPILDELSVTHRVIAPDLPGHGGSQVRDGTLGTERVLAWLGALLEATCATPPALVGLLLGGAIAARFSAAEPERVGCLVLVDSLGLRPLQPVPEFGQALSDFLARPNERTHAQLWRYCAYDVDRLRARMGSRWAPFVAYNVDRARTPSVQAAVQALLEQFGMPAIPPELLADIRVPTSLIWGRHDLATPLAVAAAASARYGWPLQVIDDAADDPPIEQPEAFLRALRVALERSADARAAGGPGSEATRRQR